jgi:hypothetical protein
MPRARNAAQKESPSPSGRPMSTTRQAKTSESSRASASAIDRASTIVVPVLRERAAHELRHLGMILDDEHPHTLPIARARRPARSPVRLPFSFEGPFGIRSGRWAPLSGWKARDDSP